jgi:glucose-6-phosphate dehydrogenase assembly protein OpcA
MDEQVASRNGDDGRAIAEREIAVHRHLMRFGDAENLATPMWVERGTSVRAIADHLAELWESPPAPTNGDVPHDALIREKGVSHARASVLNLIVTVPEVEAADRVVEAMLGLGVRHPSRAIVRVADPRAPGEPMDARISTHCHPASNRSEQICYEEVVLTVRGEAAEHLAGVVAPLLIHDLPTHVWWPGDPPFSDAVFDQLVEMGDRLIVDSADFSDLLVGMRRLSTLRRQSVVADLSWERLGWWQELTAQFFDAPRFRRYLSNINGVQIRYAVGPGSGGPDAGDVVPGAASPMSQAMLLAGWFASRLGWRRWRTEEPLTDGRLRLQLEGRYEMVDLLIEPDPTADVPAGELLGLQLRVFGEAGSAKFIIERAGHEATVATNADGMTALLRRVKMEPETEPELLSKLLVMDQRDPVYESALRAAAVFLASARDPGDRP